jgi:hypothetical protein
MAHRIRPYQLKRDLEIVLNRTRTIPLCIPTSMLSSKSEAFAEAASLAVSTLELIGVQLGIFLGYRVDALDFDTGRQR